MDDPKLHTDPDTDTLDRGERQLPAYRSHKTVWALKIAGIDITPEGIGTLHFYEIGHVPVAMPPEWLAKHEPEVGGYWVQYEDGYTSYSPAAAFEKGYTRIGPFGGLNPVISNYEVPESMLQRLETSFTYHSPTPDQIPRYAMLRSQAKATALMIVKLTPPGREQSVALTKLEEAIMWANKAIACGEAPKAPAVPR